MVRRYADLMVRARQNTFLCRLGVIFRGKTVPGTVSAKHPSGRSGKRFLAPFSPVLDRERLRRIVKTFTAAGMYYIEGGHFAGRTGGEWRATTFDTRLGGRRATSAEGNAEIARTGGQLMEEIERNGWRGRWIQHVADEPAAENAADYRILVGMVRRHMPGIPVLDATMDQSLTGSLDICPPAIGKRVGRRKGKPSQDPFNTAPAHSPPARGASACAARASAAALHDVVGQLRHDDPRPSARAVTIPGEGGTSRG